MRGSPEQVPGFKTWQRVVPWTEVYIYFYMHENDLSEMARFNAAL